MSKERAIRRAQREAAAAVVLAKRQRREQRRARRRALVRTLTPRRRRRAWLLGRRSPGQRAAIVGAAIALLWIVWYFVEPWPLRIAFTILAVLVLPLLVVMTFDRRA